MKKRTIVSGIREGSQARSLADEAGLQSAGQELRLLALVVLF
jgi:hypothetical protein